MAVLAYTPIVVPGARDATSVVPESRSDIRDLLGSMTNLVQWLFCLSLPVDEIPAFAGTTGIFGMSASAGTRLTVLAYSPIVVPGARDATSVVPESRSDIRDLLGSMTNLVQWLFCLSLPVDEIPAFAGTTGILGCLLVQGRG